MPYLSNETKSKNLRIAVNTRLLLKGKLEGIGRFSFEILKRIVLNHPEIEFIFCFDRKYHEDFVFAKNVKPIIISPPARHPFLYYIWFQWSLPQILKRHKVDLFLSPDGFLPLNTKVKTLAIIHDLAFEHYPEGVSWLSQKYYKYFFPKFALQADKIVTVSNFSKNDIIKTYKVASDKIDVVYNGVSDCFKTLIEPEKLKIIQNATNGKPYFICLGSIHPRKNLITLLKAFELFKSQNSGNSHQLLIVGRLGWKNTELEDYYKLMVYKKAVIFKGFLKDEELAPLLASATASIYPSVFEGFGLPVLESMACSTPIITTKNTAIQEIAQDAAWYFDALDVQKLASVIKNVVENPLEVNQKVQKGLAFADDYTWDKTADLLWKSIKKLS